MEDQQAAETLETITLIGFWAGFGPVAFAFLKSWFATGFPGLLAVGLQLVVATIAGYLTMLLAAAVVAPFIVTIALASKRRRR